MEEIKLDSKGRIQEHRRQETLATLGLYSLEEGDLDTIIHRAVQQLCLTLDVEYVTLLEWKQKENILQIKANTGLEVKEDHQKEIEAEKKWDVGYALRADQPVIVSDFNEEKQFKLAPFFDNHAIRSGISLKVIESNETWGVLSVYAKDKREFTKHDLDFLQIVANLIGMSSERIKSKKDIQETNKQLKQEIERTKKFQRQILDNSILERWDLGGYLHDDLGQMLVSIKIAMTDIQHQLNHGDDDVSQDIEEIIEQVDNGISAIRKLTREIIPVSAENMSVKQAFQDFVDQISRTHNISCRLETDHVIEKINDKKMATNLYHIIQEAVMNAITHGEAETIEVNIQRNGEHLELKIKDFGKGISNREKATEDDVGSGINLMRYRTELIGGAFTIEEFEAHHSGGTQITCRIPIELLSEDK